MHWRAENLAERRDGRYRFVKANRELVVARVVDAAHVFGGSFGREVEEDDAFLMGAEIVPVDGISILLRSSMEPAYLVYLNLVGLDTFPPPP